MSPARPVATRPPDRRHDKDPVLVGLGLAMLAVCAWVLTGPAAVTVSWTVQVLLDVAFGYGSWRVATLPGAPRLVRRFWLSMATGGAVFAIGDTFQTVRTFGDGSELATDSPVQTILIACGVACVVWAMLTHPLDVAGRERLRLWLDAGTIMAAAGVFTWAMLFHGAAAADVVTGLVGSGLMLVSAFGMVKLLLSGTAPFTLRSGVAGGLASGSSGLGVALAPLLADTSHPDLVTVVRLLPCFLLAATPRIQELQMRRDPASLAPRHRPYSRLPYAAVAATQLLVVYLCLTEGLTTKTWGALVGGAIIMGLVVIRQLVALHDNLRLTDRLRQQEERFRSLVQRASDITLVIDATSVVTYASPAMQRVLGVPPSRAVGTPVDEWVHPDDLSVARRMIDDVRNDPAQSLAIQIRGHSSDGRWRWLEVVGTNLLDNPSVQGIVLNARDVTESRQLHDQLRHEATHDPLTGLANRALFGERLRLASIAPHSGADPPDELTIIAIDLDKFKEINDNLGHHVGDDLLVAVAERLRASVRPSDTIARLGGDEFAVLLPHTPPAGARIVADRIAQAFAEPANIDGYTVPILASLGIAGGPSRDRETLLKDADAAMYKAKRLAVGAR